MTISNMIELPNAFTAEECQSIIDLGLSQDLAFGEVYTLDKKDGKIRADMRESRVRNIYPPEGQWIFDRIWKIAEQANVLEGVTELTYLQFTEYKAEYNGQFLLHVDQNPTSVSKMMRVVSCVVQLSDPKDYDGAELTVGETDTRQCFASKARGNAVFFPSTMLHQVRPTIAGTRYSLVAWLCGPNPRAEK